MGMILPFPFPEVTFLKNSTGFLKHLTGLFQGDDTESVVGHLHRSGGLLDFKIPTSSACGLTSIETGVLVNMPVQPETSLSHNKSGAPPS